MRSHNKVAIVTVAGTGIGKAVSLALLEDGYRVALAGRRRELLEQTAAEAGPAGAQALVVPADVTDPESVRTLFARTKDTFGRLDLLFNNAGTNVPAMPLADLSYQQCKSVVEGNLTGPVLRT